MCRAIFVVSVVPRSWLFSSRLALVVALVVAVVVPDLVDWQTTQVSFFRLNSSTFLLRRFVARRPPPMDILTVRPLTLPPSHT